NAGFGDGRHIRHMGRTLRRGDTERFQPARFDVRNHDGGAHKADLDHARHEVLLVEDAAESLGATHKGRHTGTIGRSGWSGAGEFCRAPSDRQSDPRRLP
ncbi:MAG: DegT/DnrJ/EryC1/StrS family aminotransferase, partial [Candidatus Rokubacteria bacterium]|nr:DegT/DnrJ/EryC1/StrS family aminotransferase [Candidatus Rokubacteria bacterium]